MLDEDIDLRIHRQLLGCHRLVRLLSGMLKAGAIGCASMTTWSWSGNPALTTQGPGDMAAFALRIGDLEVMQRRFDGTTWSPRQPTGTTSSPSPAAASWAANRIGLLLAMPSPALFQPLHRFWDGATWQQELLDNLLTGDTVAAARVLTGSICFKTVSVACGKKPGMAPLDWRPVPRRSRVLRAPIRLRRKA
jgi:hypothetical protein